MGTLRSDTRLKTKQARACFVHIHSLIHSLASPRLTSPLLTSIRSALASSLTHRPSLHRSSLVPPSLALSPAHPSPPSRSLSLSLPLLRSPVSPPIPKPTAGRKHTYASACAWGSMYLCMKMQSFQDELAIRT